MNCYDIMTKEIITYTQVTTYNNDHMPEKGGWLILSFYLFFDPLVDFIVKFHSANG